MRGGLVIIEVCVRRRTGTAARAACLSSDKARVPSAPELQVQYDLDGQWIRMSNFLPLEKQTGQRISLDLPPERFSS